MESSLACDKLREMRHVAPDIDHLSIPVSDLARSERFYVEALGMQVQYREPGIVMLRAGRATDLALQASDGPVDPRGHKLHFGFKVRSAAEVEAWERHVRARGAGGIRMEGRSEPDHDGACSVYFQDPDGYVFEIYYPGA